MEFETRLIFEAWLAEQKKNLDSCKLFDWTAAHSILTEDQPNIDVHYAIGLQPPGLKDSKVVICPHKYMMSLYQNHAALVGFVEQLLDIARFDKIGYESILALLQEYIKP